MVRLKVAVAVTAGALAGGFAVPSAASADTTQVVYSWGYNSWGQAGADPNVTGANVLSPVPVRGAAANVTQLSGPVGPYKGRYVLSLRSDGTVWGWGRNYIGVLGNVPGSTFTPVQIQGLPSNIVQVSAGGIHAAAVAADGSVWTWGANTVGQLGYPTPGAQYTTVPHQVPGVCGVKQVAAGADFTVALRSNGEVWTWGGNAHGQLGDGTRIDRTTPARNQAGYGMTQSARAGTSRWRGARDRCGHGAPTIPGSPATAPPRRTAPPRSSSTG